MNLENVELTERKKLTKAYPVVIVGNPGCGKSASVEFLPEDEKQRTIIFDMENKGLPEDDECFLMTKYGHPFSEKAFENKFKKWATKAGIPQCTIHGLRKIIAVKLATSGANKHEIAAWLAHDGTQTVDVYTKDVERDRLIENAQKRLGWKPFNLASSSPNSPPILSQLGISH